MPVEADSTALSVSVLPQLELGERWVIYGKLGGAHMVNMEQPDELNRLVLGFLSQRQGPVTRQVFRLGRRGAALV